MYVNTHTYSTDGEFNYIFNFNKKIIEFQVNILSNTIKLLQDNNAKTNNLICLGK